MNIGPKYEAYRSKKRENDEIREWLSHIGAKGRGKDVLSLSSAHANVKLVIAGQYSDGGTNYRDSPKGFNALLMKYIHDNFEDIRAVIVAEMEQAESEAKNATRQELQSALEELSAA